MVTFVIIILLFFTSIANAQWYGKAIAPCTTTGTLISGSIEPTLEAATAGSTFRIAAGTYNTGVINVPDGTASQPIIITSNNCAEVVINGSFLLGNYNFVQGLTIKGSATQSVGRVVEFKGGSVGAEVKYNKLDGSDAAIIPSTSALGNIRWGTAEFLLAYNEIIGSFNNADMASSGQLRNQKIWYNHISNCTGDCIALNSPWTGAAGKTLHILGNTFFSVSSRGEQYIDTKAPTVGTTGTILIEKNYFRGAGQVTASSCVLLWGRNNSSENIQTIFRDNIVEDCTPTGGNDGVSTYAGGTQAVPEGLGITFETSIINCAAGQGDLGAIKWAVDNPTWNNLTIDGCNFRVDNHSTNNPQVSGGTFRNVLWSNASRTGEVPSSTITSCSHNNRFNITGTFPWDGSCTNAFTVNPTFATGTWDVTNGTLINAGFGSRTPGALQSITFVSAEINGTELIATFTGGVLPYKNCVLGNFTITYQGTPATKVSCTAGVPASNKVTINLSSPPLSSDTVLLSTTHGAFSDSAGLGGPGIDVNAKVRALTSLAVTNSTTGTWRTGVVHNIPTGSNRFCTPVFAWEHVPTTPPLNISNVRIGGQACTQIAEIDEPDNQAALTTLAEMWGCNEAAIAAATSGNITYDQSETPGTNKPIAVAMGCLTGVNQTGSVVASAVASTASNTTLSTSALATENPAAAIFVAVHGNNTGNWTVGSGWTKQLQFAEDAEPAMQVVVGSRATDGTNVTPNATFDSSGRIVILGASFKASAVAPPPPSGETLVREQFASKCALADRTKFTFQYLENQGCKVVSGGIFTLVNGMKVLNDNAPTATAKVIQCCSDGVCDEPSDFFTVGDTFGNNAVAYAGDTEHYVHGTSITSNPLDTTPSGTFVNGRIRTRSEFLQTTFNQNQFTVYADVLKISDSFTGNVVCRLALEGNLPFESYGSTVGTINVNSLLGSGF